MGSNTRFAVQLVAVLLLVFGVAVGTRLIAERSMGPSAALLCALMVSSVAGFLGAITIRRIAAKR